MAGLTITIVNGALGALPTNTGVGRAKVGVCTLGSPGTVYTIQTLDAIKTNLGNGPLAEACAYELSLAGAPVYASVASATVPGTAVSTVTLTGTSPLLSTTGSSPKDAYDVIVTVASGTTLTTGVVFNVSLDYNGSAGVTTTQITVTGSTTTPAYLLDPIGLSTGITLNFPIGTYVTGDKYVFRTFPPYMSSASMQNAVRALGASNNVFSVLHLVGCDQSSTDAANIASAITLITAFNTELTTFQTNGRFVAGVAEMPDMQSLTTVSSGWSAWDTAAASAGSGVTLARVAIGAGHLGATSALTGLFKRRSVGHFFAADAGRLIASNQHQVDPSAFREGAIVGVTAIYRDDTKTTTKLDTSRYVTCSGIQVQGAFLPYFTRSPVFCLATDDYALWPRRVILDLFAQVLNEAALQYVNDGVQVNPDGTIFELSARAIESGMSTKVTQYLPYNGNNAKISPPAANVPIVQVDRTTNVLATNTLTLKGQITPFGYFSSVTVSVGFVGVSITNATRQQ